MLDEMTQRNPSKFSIFLSLKIPKNDTHYGGDGGQKSKTFALIAQNFPNPGGSQTTTTTSTTTTTCSGTCGDPDYKGDGYCDDTNNYCGCEWDGGDCCETTTSTSTVITDYCSVCECLDPNANAADTTTDPPTTTTTDPPTTTNETTTTGTTVTIFQFRIILLQ